MKKSAIKEKINNHIELRKPLWTILIVLTGGLVTLAFSPDSVLKYLLLTVGGVINIFIFLSICEHNTRIEELIKQLEDKD